MKIKSVIKSPHTWFITVYIIGIIAYVLFRDYPIQSSGDIVHDVIEQSFAPIERLFYFFWFSLIVGGFYMFYVVTE